MIQYPPPTYTALPGSPVTADTDTGLFCRAGCSRPLESSHSLQACPNPKTALEWGFLPCDECRPMDVSFTDFPVDEQSAVRILMDEIATQPGFTIKAGSLMERGLDPDRIGRRYQLGFGLSFQDFLRMRRVNLILGVSGTSVLVTADDDVVFTRLSTPLGPMLAGATAAGLCLLEFAERRMMETQLKRLRKYHSGRLVVGSRGIFKQLEKELDEYFRGERRVFNVPLNLMGTRFQLNVWDELRRIPWGDTRSYGEQARSLGDTRAVRAVARANGDNPISIIVPCHRVLGADGSMTGYGGRIWRKEALLRLESGQGELFR